MVPHLLVQNHAYQQCERVGAQQLVGGFIAAQVQGHNASVCEFVSPFDFVGGPCHERGGPPHGVPSLPRGPTITP